MWSKQPRHLSGRAQGGLAGGCARPLEINLPFVFRRRGGAYGRALSVHLVRVRHREVTKPDAEVARQEATTEGFGPVVSPRFVRGGPWRCENSVVHCCSKSRKPKVQSDRAFDRRWWRTGLLAAHWNTDRLWPNRSVQAAVHMVHRDGYRPVNPFACLL